VIDAGSILAIIPMKPQVGQSSMSIFGCNLLTSFGYINGYEHSDRILKLATSIPATASDELRFEYSQRYS
jgi:hypothetical protein